MEKFEVKRRTWQAKSVGTIVSIIGASVMTLYQGPTILGSSSTSTSDLPQQYSLLSQDSSRWVVGGVMIVASYVVASGWYILKTAILKDYPEQITIVFFSTFFSSIQCAIVTLFLERKLDAWKLQPGIGMTAIVASAVLEPVCVNNIAAFCLVMKGPLGPLFGQTAILKDYPEQITIVFFSTLFSSIQCAIVTLLLERKLDAWKLQPGIGMIAIVASAVLEPVCVNNIAAFCLVIKGPLYVAMFKPLGVVIAAIMNLIFLAEALHLGSIVGSIIISVGFYVVMWGMLREATEILGETTEAANQTSPLLQK
nr:WAT1-related protein At3g28050-like isoform X3 [Ipomoea trifida]